MDSKLLKQMCSLKLDMLSVSAQLHEKGYSDHAAEMKGAAKILQTWINGIRKDNKQQQPKAEQSDE